MRYRQARRPQGKDVLMRRRYAKGGTVKDDCYHKVKRSYRVFPSAYSSGAIAKCRKAKANGRKKD